jgi:O-acetyl-ADP-ribose deacetylase (regulator of RNase III)
MIRYTQGNLLEADAEALVNAVNEVGVMGKGIALAFRDAFSDNTRAYVEACRRGEVKVGRMFVTRNVALFGPHWIINFPTKKHWRNPSRIEWIREGLKELVGVVRQHGIRSIALPALGCGNGGLDWNQVRREIEGALGEAEGLDVVVFEPGATLQSGGKGR